jgi:hypothetical protein
MIYTRQMMKPGESFVLIRTNEIYTVGPYEGSLVFNETRKKWTNLHRNCHVMPIKKKETK